MKKYNRNQYNKMIKESERKQSDLAYFYRNIFSDILKSIEGLDIEGIDSLTKLRANRHYQAILNNIDKLFADLDATTRKYLREIITMQYEAGKLNGLLDVQALAVAKKFPVTKLDYTFALADRRKINAAINKSYNLLAVGNSMTKKNIKRIMEKTIKEEIVNNVATGKGMQNTTKSLVEKMEKQGITGFKTPSGRTYNKETYCNLVVRTETMNAHNSGNIQMMDDFGFDLVHISYHSGACKVCQQYEKEIYSISGKDKRYKPLSSLPNGGPPFHPNCRHVIKPYIEKFEKNLI